MSEKRSYGMIDILKLIFSFCIVALHTNLWMTERPTLYWYLSHCIWRIAVPFFFITSGYFFCMKIKSSKEPKQILKNTLKRLSLLFGFWMIVSLPLKISTLKVQGYSSFNLLIQLIKEALFYPWGALWYLLALMIGIILIYPFVKARKKILPLCIGMFLFIIK